MPVSIITVALIWSVSRTALIAAAAALFLATLMMRISSRRRRHVSSVILIALGAAVVFLPFLINDPAAFTGRGAIWSTTIFSLESNWIFGLGSSWYEYVGVNMPSLFSDGAAFHGHNDFITSSVNGGLVLVLLEVILLVYAWRRSATLSSTDSVIVFWFFVTMLVAGTTETVWRYDVLNPIAVSLFIPLATLVTGRIENSKQGLFDYSSLTAASPNRKPPICVARG